jgi:EAL domain-containing protein (putative c-di-GMP-specific phosphodiesterase class I)
MFQAKQSGRNQFHLFDAQHDRQIRTHHNQRARINQALQDGEFRLYFQPKVNMLFGKVVGMEALLRWQHPEQGMVGPLHFLPMVEQTDLIIDIGEWVIHQALAQLRSLANGEQQWVVSVNIAARHFQRSDFLLRLSSILASYPEVSPSLLEIEILESAAIQDIQYVRDVMLGCQQLGVRFALDDFGTGYSSLSYLKRLPANTLKIDQSFVRDMLVDQEDLTLISAIIGLAKAFKLEVIAEGVESAEQGVALMQLGCNQAQGYGIARPMPANDVSAWANTYRMPPSWARNAFETT